MTESSSPPSASPTAVPRRALVTGANGFLGRALVAQLLETDLVVRCLVRRESDETALRARLPQQAQSRLEFAIGSFERPGDAKVAVEGCEIVYHLGAALGAAPAKLVLTNVVGTRTLIDAALAAGVKRFVLVSSLAVHATAPLARGAMLSPNAPLEPRPQERDAYCYSKVRQEQVAWEAHRDRGLGLVVVRPGVLYGPGRGVMSNRIGLRFGNFLFRVGGWQRLPYCDVDNAAQAVLLGGTTPGVEGEAFLAVDDRLPTGRQLIRAHRRSGQSLHVLWLPLWTIGMVSDFCEWYHRWSRGQLPAVFTRATSDALWKPLRYDTSATHQRLGWRPAPELENLVRRATAPAESACG